MTKKEFMDKVEYVCMVMLTIVMGIGTCVCTITGLQTKIITEFENISLGALLVVVVIYEIGMIIKDRIGE